MSKFSGAHLNLSKFSSAPVFGGSLAGVFCTTTSRSSSVDMSASCPSRPPLDPAACTGRIKGQGGEMARTVAHGAGVGTASTRAGGIACEPLAASPPSSARVRPSSMCEPAAAAASGGRGVVLSPLPQRLAHPVVTAAGSVLSAA